MAWSSAYNEALCALFLLTAALALFRSAIPTTGRRRLLVVADDGGFHPGIWRTFPKSIRCYPALAAAYVLFVTITGERRREPADQFACRRFCISLAYFLMHKAAVSRLPQRRPLRRLPSIGEIFRTFAAYWRWSLRPHAILWKRRGQNRSRSCSAYAICDTRPLRRLLAFFISGKLRQGALREGSVSLPVWFLLDDCAR